MPRPKNCSCHAPHDTWGSSAALCLLQLLLYKSSMWIKPQQSRGYGIKPQQHRTISNDNVHVWGSVSSNSVQWESSLGFCSKPCQESIVASHKLGRTLEHCCLQNNCSCCNYRGWERQAANKRYRQAFKLWLLWDFRGIGGIFGYKAGALSLHSPCPGICAWLNTEALCLYVGTMLWHCTPVREKDQDWLDFLSAGYLFCNMNTRNLHADILTSDLSPGAQLCSHCGGKGRFGTLLNKTKKIS